MVLWLITSVALSIGVGPDTLEAVDLYGLRTVPEQQVRTAAPGDPTPHSVELIRARLLRIPGIAAVDVSAVCCGERGGSVLYVGIREEGTPPLTFRSAPSGEARLPEKIVELGARFDAALIDAVRRGTTAEDASQGYAWSSDSMVRSIQKAFLDVARADFDTLVSVLRTSADSAHRALAGQIIAYATDKPTVVAELLRAIHDPSGGVRNNAARALALLARWAQESPQAGLSIAVDPFVDLLNSLSWTDRNKGVLVLVPLTADRRPALLAELRARALPSLVEMARWSNPGHALGPYIILARMAGVEDAEAFEAWQAGNRETIIERALVSGR